MQQRRDVFEASPRLIVWRAIKQGKRVTEGGEEKGVERVSWKLRFQRFLWPRSSQHADCSHATRQPDCSTFSVTSFLSLVSKEISRSSFVGKSREKDHREFQFLKKKKKRRYIYEWNFRSVVVRIFKNYLASRITIGTIITKFSVKQSLNFRKNCSPVNRFTMNLFLDILRELKVYQFSNYLPSYLLNL